MLIFDNGIIKAYARIFPENRKRTRLEIEQTEESPAGRSLPPDTKTSQSDTAQTRATAP